MSDRNHEAGQSSGSCLLNHLYFHGLSSKPDNLAEPGQPLVLIFHHNQDYSIDKIWVAKLAKSFLRKQRNAIVFSNKHLAFETYKRDMIFNALPGHTLLYDPNQLWLAVYKAFKEVTQPGSEWFKIYNSCASVGFEQVDMWHVPDRGCLSSPAARGSGESALPFEQAESSSGSLEKGEESSEDGDSSELSESDESDKSSDSESEGSGRSARSNEAAGGNQRSAEQRERERVFRDTGAEFDEDWEVDPDFAEVLEMIDSNKEAKPEERGEQLCRAYERLEYLRGLRDARDGFKQRMDSLGGTIA